MDGFGMKHFSTLSSNNSLKNLEELSNEITKIEYEDKKTSTVSYKVQIVGYDDDINEENLFDKFSIYGNLLRIEMNRKMPYNLATITFENRKSADECIMNENGKSYQRNRDNEVFKLSVRYSTETSEIIDRMDKNKNENLRQDEYYLTEQRFDPNNRIIIKNMPTTISVDECWNTFGVLGSIVSINLIVTEKYSSCYVIYRDIQSAIEAVKKFSHRYLNGEKISIYFAPDKGKTYSTYDKYKNIGEK
ncbi:hypothetical protein SNEBB_004700 [Seison nebaliae]|nr:hypothetical protein SNEBB_004700 [Seison nebaliae]